MKKTKKLQLWAKGGEFAMVVDPEDLEKSIDLRNSDIIRFPEIDPSDELIKKLNEDLAKREESLNIDNIEDFLEEHKIKNYFVFCSDIEEPNKGLAYDFYNHEFFDFSDLEEDNLYSFWNGSNWIYKWSEDYVVTEIEVSVDRYSLDEFDGRNYTTGGIGLHQYVYKKYTEDGETCIDEYFVLCTSQWQGHVDEGILMNEGQLVNHLKKLGRDIEEYMKEIKKLE